MSNSKPIAPYALMLEYPSSDGKPMADNTKQARWIVTLYNNLHQLFHGQEVFVAADLFWYPVEGQPTIRVAPDAMVVIGRPEGDRPSYLQWLEEDLPPQVVFEVLSPSNTKAEMRQKLEFYQRYGVEEYIVIDPDGKAGKGEHFIAYWREGGALITSDFSQVDWTSQRLGVRFRLEEGKLRLFFPDGSPFLGFVEVNAELEKKNQALAEKEQALEEKDRVLVEKDLALAQAAAELEALRARLKALEDQP